MQKWIDYFKNNILFKVILIALLVIITTNNGSLVSFDTSNRLAVTRSWLIGQEEVDPNYKATSRGDVKAGVIGVNGKRYVSYELGQSMLMLPGYWLSMQLYKPLHKTFFSLSFDQFSEMIIVYLIFLPINVLAVLICFFMTKMFGFSERIAALSSVIWLTCSTFLVYTQDAQQNNQILLFVLLSYSYILAYLQENKLKFLVLSGLSASASLLIRTSSIIHVFTILMFTISCLLFYHSKILISIRKLIPWILGFAPLAILGRFLDYLRYGSPWTTGQSLAVQQINTDPKWDGFPPLPANYPFLNDPYIGIVNVLFSPVKSIFIYDPLFIPCLIIGAIFWNRLSFFLKTYIIVGIVNLTLHIILTSKLIFWGGDWAWGARYHVTSIHLLIIPLLALLTREILLSKKWRKWCLQGMLVIALLVQIASVSMSYNVEITQSPFYQKYLAPESYASQFRLGERIGNIACQIYPDISKQCTKIDWVWPFKKNPTLIWIWRLLLVLSITSLLWFWRHIESLIALTRNL